MENKVIIEGYLERIIFSSDKCCKFVIKQWQGKYGVIKHITCTIFDKDLIEKVNDMDNETLYTLYGSIYDNNYKDKNGNWVNSWNLVIEEIEW